MHRFRAREGRFPRRLDELVPDFLDAVPDDPFDGRPLRLRQDDQGWVLYSVGANIVDDGGARDPGRGLPPDVIFRYPWRPEPEADAAADPSEGEGDDK